MWIKYDGGETINLDYVQSIEKEEYEYEGVTTYGVKFWQKFDNECTYIFPTEEKRDQYFEALNDFVEAQEIPLLKI